MRSAAGGLYNSRCAITWALYIHHGQVLVLRLMGVTVFHESSMNLIAAVSKQTLAHWQLLSSMLNIKLISTGEHASLCTKGPSMTDTKTGWIWGSKTEEAGYTQACSTVPTWPLWLYQYVENLPSIFFCKSLESILRDCCNSLWAPAVFPHSAATTGGKVLNMPPANCPIFDKHFAALDKYSSAAWNCPWIAMTGVR